MSGDSSDAGPKWTLRFDAVKGARVIDHHGTPVPWGRSITVVPEQVRLERDREATVSMARELRFIAALGEAETLLDSVCLDECNYNASSELADAAYKGLNLIRESMGLKGLSLNERA